MDSIIKIGTRASPLAMVQAEEVKALLHANHGLADEETSLHPMTTRGDQQQSGEAFATWGYKGLFTREIDDALLSGDVNCAVHSMKDMPSVLPEGIMIACVLPREDVRDAFISERYESFDALPQGAVLGTSSLRRASQIKHLRPDITIKPFRGSVQTRLRKLSEGDVDATLLAMAGLKRLDMVQHAKEAFHTETLVPAVAQGAIAITCRSADENTQATLASLHHRETGLCVNAERALLRGLDGSCRTPIAGYATLKNDTLTLSGVLSHPSGEPYYSETQSAPASEAETLGEKVAQCLRERAGDVFRTWTATC